MSGGRTKTKIETPLIFFVILFKFSLAFPTSGHFLSFLDKTLKKAAQLTRTAQQRPEPDVRHKPQHNTPNKISLCGLRATKNDSRVNPVGTVRTEKRKTPKMPEPQKRSQLPPTGT